MRIYLDMDGTIANLYAIENWLEMLNNFDTTPYEKAEPMVSEETLLNLINNGFELAIVSWTSKGNNKDYDKAVRKAKKEWLKKVFPNVVFAEMHIVKYGTPKSQVVNNKFDILVDDELPNRKNWKGLAIDPMDFF